MKNVITDCDYKLLFKQLPNKYCYVAVDSPKFTIIDATEANLLATELKREDIIGKGTFEVFPDNPEVKYNSSGKMRDALLHVMETKELFMMDIIRYDLPIPDSDKFDFKYWSIQLCPIFNEAGELTSIIINAADITSLLKMGGAQP